MNQTYINLTASNQHLSIQGEPLRLASKTVNFVKAHFELGENWDGFDSVRAVWSTDFNKGVPAVLDSLGDCVVPHEVLTRVGKVRVNLVGSVSENDVLTDRLTTCLVSAIEVCCNVPVDGTEPQTITPTQFEQFVEAVRDDADRAETASTEARESADEASESATSASQSASASAESAAASEQSATASARDAQTVSEIAVEVEVMKNEAELARDEIFGMRAEAVTLPAGSEATASYADGLLSLGIPRGNTGATGAKGDKGDTGATPNLTIGNVETLEPTESATATITGTAENPVLNLGIPQGQTGEVSLADLSTLLPTDTASGDIASFPDGQSVIPLLSLIADIEPIQSGSGTPSPSNPRPISGHTECVTEVCGMNVWDEEWEVGGINTDGSLATNHYRLRSKNYISIIPNTAYYFASDASSGYSSWLIMCFYDGDKNFVSFLFPAVNLTFNTPSNARFMKFCTSDAWNGRTYEGGFSINYPSTDHDYHAYAGHDYTTDFGQTVYGGTLDVVSGELTVTHAYTNLGVLNYNKSVSPQRFEATTTLPNCKAPASSSEALNGLCTEYEIYSADAFSGQDASMYMTTSGLLRIYDSSRYSLSASDFKTAMGDVQICYELASPQTIQLTPQQVYALLGENNIWADSGEVEVVYKADVTKWVEKKLNS